MDVSPYSITQHSSSQHRDKTVQNNHLAAIEQPCSATLVEGDDATITRNLTHKTKKMKKKKKKNGPPQGVLLMQINNQDTLRPLVNRTPACSIRQGTLPHLNTAARGQRLGGLMTPSSTAHPRCHQGKVLRGRLVSDRNKNRTKSHKKSHPRIAPKNAPLLLADTDTRTQCRDADADQEATGPTDDIIAAHHLS
jgi:hypothetical protein